MTQETLFRLVEAFDAGTMTRLEYCEGEAKLVLERTVCAPLPMPTALPAAPAVPVAAAPAAPVTAPVPEAAAQPGAVIKAPLVGTFYAASEPGKPAFVSVGDTVKKGSTVCIIEAMKMINEIPAPFDCVIEECPVGDGELVGFDDTLFVVREL